MVSAFELHECSQDLGPLQVAVGCACSSNVGIVNERYATVLVRMKMTDYLRALRWHAS